jgi:thymidylate synthase (FAD)
MTDEFYLPDNDHIAEQSTTNKQGSEDLGSITDEDRDGVRWLMQAASETNYEIYEALLGSRKEHVPYDPFNSLNGKDPIIDPNFKGIAKETARMVLTLNNYTEFYWKTNLKNLMNFLRLRTDYHAQSEIQNYANAMETLVKNTNRLDFAFEAFDDYIRYAKKLSRMEYELMKDLIAELIDNELLSSSINSRAGKYGLSARETLALVNKFKL